MKWYSELSADSPRLSVFHHAARRIERRIALPPMRPLPADPPRRQPPLKRATSRGALRGGSAWTLSFSLPLRRLATWDSRRRRSVAGVGRVVARDTAVMAAESSTSAPTCSLGATHRRAQARVTWDPRRPHRLRRGARAHERSSNDCARRVEAGGREFHRLGRHSVVLCAANRSTRARSTKKTVGGALCNLHLIPRRSCSRTSSRRRETSRT